MKDGKIANLRIAAVVIGMVTLTIVAAATAAHAQTQAFVPGNATGPTEVSLLWRSSACCPFS